MRIFRAFLVFVAYLSYPTSESRAHDKWANGKPIPDWIKSSCCGEADAHHLEPNQVHRISDDFYRVDGYSRLIPVGAALPSQDGDYWIFYREANTCPTNAAPGTFGGGTCAENTQSGVYCFFVPMDF